MPQRPQIQSATVLRITAAGQYTDNMDSDPFGKVWQRVNRHRPSRSFPTSTSMARLSVADKHYCSDLRRNESNIDHRVLLVGPKVNLTAGT